MFEVKKAKRTRRPLKISLEGISGAGKTFTALRLAFAMKRAGIGSKIVVADSENSSAGLYAGTQCDGDLWEFDTCDIPQEARNPRGYTECYTHLASAGYDIIIFDSLSHAWYGAVEKVDKLAKGGDKFRAWGEVTPEQRFMLTTLTNDRAHCIVTMRVKSEYDRVDEGGKSKFKKVGMKTDQREGSEYEFDCVVRLEEGHMARVEKVRGCTAMDGATARNPDPTFWKPLLNWYLSAEPTLSLFETAGTSLKQCKSLAELQVAYTAIYKAKDRYAAKEFELLTQLKDEMKAKLQPPANNTPANENDIPY